MQELQQILIYFILPLLVLGYVGGYLKVSIWARRGITFCTTPNYAGWYVVIWAFVPTITLSVIAFVMHALPGVSFPVPRIFALSLAGIAAGAAIWAFYRLAPEIRVYHFVERCILGLLLTASTVSVLTTLGIILSVVFEATKFFQEVSLWHFLTGTEWSPDTAFVGGAGREGEEVSKPLFGSVPLFAGTFMITLIAMLIALPVGILTAIATAEYAPLRIRRIAKPALEILAGIPTVVYGFFAAVTVSPMIVKAASVFGVEASYTNALAPGLVMGIMIIPLVSSLCDDVIVSIPQSLAEGSYALGGTQSETIKRVLMPVAFPGIISAFLLAVSRAIGETMIVVMAAGLRANLTWNPMEGMTTVTVRIVDALTGDQSFDSLETLSAFALGLILLIFTLVLNVISAIIIRKFRKQYGSA